MIRTGMFEVEVVSDTSRELNAFTVEVAPKEEIRGWRRFESFEFCRKSGDLQKHM